MSDLLSYADLQKVIDAALAAELAEPDRRRLLFFRMADLKSKMPQATSNNLQLRTDLVTLNPAAVRSDGTHPLLIWLQNARPLVAGTDQQKFFERLVSRLESRPSGGAGMRGTGSSATSAGTLELFQKLQRQAILIQDDMLPVDYVRDAAFAARSVARLRVRRHDGGSDSGKRYWGTGWLLTPSLLITNHHVINARDDDEADAPAPDFKKQALGTTAQFDVDSDATGAEPVCVAEVLATDPSLDYAVLRLATAAPYPGLPADSKPFLLGRDEVVPLNIIQHPNGRPKMLAIRNNLATAAASPELRYFTSTLAGSSGAPVFSDQWKVVGIHRGAIGTKVLSFQGHSTAMVNMGTQMSAILDALPLAIRQEIAAQ